LDGDLQGKGEESVTSQGVLDGYVVHVEGYHSALTGRSQNHRIHVRHGQLWWGRLSKIVSAIRISTPQQLLIGKVEIEDLKTLVPAKSARDTEILDLNQA